jgi:hypothetical protein
VPTDGTYGTDLVARGPEHAYGWIQTEVRARQATHRGLRILSGRRSTTDACYPQAWRRCDPTRTEEATRARTSLVHSQLYASPVRFSYGNVSCWFYTHYTQQDKQNGWRPADENKLK